MRALFFASALSADDGGVPPARLAEPDSRTPDSPVKRNRQREQEPPGFLAVRLRKMKDSTTASIPINSSVSCSLPDFTFPLSYRDLVAPTWLRRLLHTIVHFGCVAGVKASAIWMPATGCGFNCSTQHLSEPDEASAIGRLGMGFGLGQQSGHVVVIHGFALPGGEATKVGGLCRPYAFQR